MKKELIKPKIPSPSGPIVTARYFILNIWTKFVRTWDDPIIIEFFKNLRIT
jgi:hypothetical protein